MTAMTAAAYRAVMDREIARLVTLSACPERAERIAALRSGANLYSPPFSSARFTSTDAASAQRGTPSATESSPTGDDSQESTVRPQRTEFGAVDD